MRGLLDDELLDGPHEVSTWLRPERFAHPVAAGDIAGALAEMEWLCQLWGGVGRPLVPVRAGQMPSVYNELLKCEEIDYVGHDIDVATPFRVEQKAAWDAPMVLLASREPRDEWVRPVEVVELAHDDPWRPIYAAVLGSLPGRPDSEKLAPYFLRKDLTFEELFPVRRVQVVGSLSDLLSRLDAADHVKPRRLSNLHLASGLSLDSGFLEDERVIPERGVVRRAAGPNIIVVMSPGSVEDVALLWNLRAAHGDTRPLPIGVPVGQLDHHVLEELTRFGRATPFGLTGGRCHVTSSSLSREELAALVAGGPTTVVASEAELLTFGPAPGRPGNQIGMWRSGRARFVISDDDRKVVRSLWEAGSRGVDLLVDIKVRGRPLPRNEVMRGAAFSASYRAGAAQGKLSHLRPVDAVDIAWPPTWTCLAATAKARGLTVKASDAGQAAVTLLESLGSIDQVWGLLHAPLIDLLYRLGERSGMAWWKSRWASVHKQLLAQGVTDDVLEQAARDLGRDDPAIAPSGEGRDVPFADFQRAVGGKRDAAEKWVIWAERKHLLVRGVRVRCPSCGGRSWLPMASTPPPVGCAGCGREIAQPYGASELKFTYRLGEPLRRVLETDSLGHVIALRWLTILFDSATLVGAHPGVTFIDQEGRDVGEADVLLLFGNGDLVPVEVKRRVAGTAGRTAELMDTLADALDAPWDALAVTQPARDCPELTALERRLPERPRLLLTDDQLHDDQAFWAVGENPFAWEPRDQKHDQMRQADFVKAVRNGLLERPQDFVSSPLLDGSD